MDEISVLDICSEPDIFWMCKLPDMSRASGWRVQQADVAVGLMRLAGRCGCWADEVGRPMWLSVCCDCQSLSGRPTKVVLIVT